MLEKALKEYLDPEMFKASIEKQDNDDNNIQLYNKHPVYILISPPFIKHSVHSKEACLPDPSHSYYPR